MSVADPRRALLLRAAHPWAVPCALVSEIMPLPPVTPLPGASEDVLGVAWIRNRIRRIGRLPGGRTGDAAPRHVLVTDGDACCVAASGRIDLVDPDEVPEGTAWLDAAALAGIGGGTRG